jgi:hypothetical protein
MIDGDIADQTRKKNQDEKCSVQAFVEHINRDNTPSTYLRTLITLAQPARVILWTSFSEISGFLHSYQSWPQAIK